MRINIKFNYQRINAVQNGADYSAKFSLIARDPLDRIVVAGRCDKGFDDLDTAVASVLSTL